MLHAFDAMVREAGGRPDTLLATTTYCAWEQTASKWHVPGFDISVLEIFWPLCFGFRLFLSSMLTARHGARLAQLLETQKASVLQGTPALWRSLISAGWRGHAGRVLVLAG